MALPSVENANYPTPEEILNQLLSDLRFSFDILGITKNVKPNSEAWIRAKAIADRISIAIANNEIVTGDFNPLTAVGEPLEDLSAVFGVTRRPASKAAGNVIVGVTGAAPVVIPLGFLITSAEGNEYETTAALAVSDGDRIEVISTGTGDDQDVAANATMTWNSAAIGALAQTALVDAGEIDGGADEDDDETLRRRLIQRLSFPQVGGNTAQIADFAEDATAAVERAYVNAAVRGPGSYDVAVTAAGGDRTLSNANVNIVANAIVGSMPGHADLNVTSVNQQQVDIIIDVDLPLPVNAGGAGGGFKDSVPWPSDLETGPNVFAEITSKIVNTITVNSTTPDTPKIGQRFAVWNPTGGDDGDGNFEEFTISFVSGSTGAFVITIDTSNSGSLAFITVGMYCSAGADRLQDYGSTFRDEILRLGPGEKTTNVDIVPRANRFPKITTEDPVALTSLLFSPLTDQDDGFTEIEDIDYAGRFDTGTKTARTTPSTPATTADAPRILTLKHLAFRAKVA